MRFKIGKKETDIRQEAVANNQGQNPTNLQQPQIDNQVNVEQIEIDIQSGAGGAMRNEFHSGGTNNPYGNPSKNYKSDCYLDYKKEHNEENLDR